MTEQVQIYHEFLNKLQLRSTRQRQVMFEAFLKLKEHVSAEEFCVLIKRIDSTIGQATVYRMLKLLADAGIARRLEMGEGLVLYEPNIGQEHHDHLICETCMKCIEFNDDEIEKQQVRLASEYGFVLSRHKMFLYGTCRECQKKMEMITRS